MSHSANRVVLLQMNSELQCVTAAASGTISVHTPAGVATIAYSAASLSVSAVVTGVIPSVWSTSTTTAITISGSRFGTSLPVGRGSIPLCLSTALINSNCTFGEVVCHMNGTTSSGGPFAGEPAAFFSHFYQLKFVLNVLISCDRIILR